MFYYKNKIKFNFVLFHTLTKPSWSKKLYFKTTSTFLGF